MRARQYSDAEKALSSTVYDGIVNADADSEAGKGAVTAIAAC